LNNFLFISSIKKKLEKNTKVNTINMTNFKETNEKIDNIFELSERRLVVAFIGLPSSGKSTMIN
jgi:ribosome biogenesis GTPase A